MSWKTSGRRARLPAGWSSTIVPRILRRDGGLCHLCGAPGADAVDHMEPGDDHSDANLAAVHHDVPPHCHRRKTAYEGLVAQFGEVAPRRQPEPHPGTVR